MILNSLINCTEPLIKLIQSHAIEKKYTSGDLILLKDTPINHTAILIEGVLKAHLDQEDNSLLLYHICPRRNPIIAVMNMTETYTSPISITAIKNSTLLWIPNSKISEWQIQFISLKKAIINSSEYSISSMITNAKNLMTNSIEKRLLNYLRNKSCIYEELDIHISRAEISSDLKVPPASISRAIKKLENQHKIIGKTRSIQLIA